MNHPPACIFVVNEMGNKEIYLYLHNPSNKYKENLNVIDY